MEFVASGASVPSEQLGVLVRAHALAPAGVPAGHALGPEVQYALLRGGLPADRKALLARGPRAHRRALEAAVKANIVRLARPVEEVVLELERTAADATLESTGEGGKTSLGAILGTVMPIAAQRELLISYRRHQGLTDAFWKSVAAVPAFQEPSAIERAQTALRLGAITRRHVPLMRRLQGMITQARDVAKLDEADFLALINEPGIGTPEGVAGESALEKARAYARELAAAAEEAFPTTALTARLARAGAPGDAAVVRFFEQNPELEPRGDARRGLSRKAPSGALGRAGSGRRDRAAAGDGARLPADPSLRGDEGASGRGAHLGAAHREDGLEALRRGARADARQDGWETDLPARGVAERGGPGARGQVPWRLQPHLDVRAARPRRAPARPGGGRRSDLAIALRVHRFPRLRALPIGL